ncbi:MAG: hypothetical protein AAF514_02760 [Verrucomicrobiota bacterium]
MDDGHPHRWHPWAIAVSFSHFVPLVTQQLTTHRKAASSLGTPEAAQLPLFKVPNGDPISDRTAKRRGRISRTWT